MNAGKMNPRVKRMWLKALRSGKYAQGRGQLCKPPDRRSSDYRFCCLGVLTDLAVQDGVDIAWTEHKGYVAVAGHTGSLPEQVAIWAGCDVDAWQFGSEKGGLAKRNDNGASFRQIADLIERDL